MLFDPDEFPESLLDGRYVVGAPIVHGQQASVFRGTDTVQKRTVALKLFRAPDIDQYSQGDRFLAEARLMSRLRHPNLVGVYDFGVEQDFYWYSMELVAAGSLQRLVDTSGPVPVRKGCRWMVQVLDALATVHRMGALHRDVQPANILLDKEDNPKLADFGMARHAEGSVGFQTQFGQSVGTVEWAAPEQLANAHDVTPAADVYGAGCTLGFMLTGLRPTKLSIHMHEDKETVLHIDGALMRIISKAIKWDAEARFADAKEFRNALQPWGLPR